MLIINAKDDTFVRKNSSTGLKAMFPKVEFHAFESGRHVLSLTNHDEYSQLITNFLDKE